jgi:hypothetical protein
VTRRYALVPGGAVTGVTKYYIVYGHRVAVRQAPDGSGTQTGTLNYLLSDHLGSTVGPLDTNGNLVPGSKTTYWPYGGARSAA